jgi:hypoxanthine phosphoribosyltransferase
MYRYIRKGINLVKQYIKTSDNPAIAETYILSSNLIGPNYNYIPMMMISSDIFEWCKKISSDFDIVVAIPRSGMIIGSVIASYFGKPLSTPDMIIEGKQWMSSISTTKHNINLNFYNTILVVDDSICSGQQMEHNVNLIQSYLPNKKIIKAVLYKSKESSYPIDFFYKEVSSQNLNQYDFSLMHQKLAANIACDLDGILCKDYAGQNYDDFLRNAIPHRIPTFEIDSIVTARPEEYREITEEWLKKHNVRYKKLYMLPEHNNTDIQKVLKFKTNILLKEKPDLYWESNPYLAKECHERTGIRTLCFENGILYV